MLFWCFEAYFENSQRTFLFSQKMAISERSSEILRKFAFLNRFEKGLILRKIWICLNNFFDQTRKCRNLNKNVFFFLKVSHIWLNYAFQMFWSIFGEIHRELLFLVQKVAISERSTEKLWKLVYLNMFENLDLFKQFFLEQTSKRGILITKNVFLTKVSHVQLNYAFLMFWSIFGEIHRELSF